GEYLAEYEILAAAVEEAREAGILGEVRITVHRGAGAYICGEETALLESLEGKRGQPRPRPPFPPIQGLYAAPTQINNVCTIATVPVILELGAEEFAKTGVPSSPGTAIFSVSGNIARPGNYELDGADPRGDRERHRDARRPRAARLGRRQHPRQGPLRARRVRRLPGRELPPQVARRVRGPRRAGRLPVRRRVVARGDPRALRP